MPPAASTTIVAMPPEFPNCTSASINAPAPNIINAEPK